MRSKAILVGAVIAFILAVAATLAWTLANKDEPARLSSLQYAFLEHYTETRAELVGNNTSDDAYVYLGYPTYNASQAAEAIKNRYALPPVNDSLKAIFQEGNAVGKAGCHGTQMNVSGVYQFPYDTGQLRILSVDGDGAAYIMYNGQPVILYPKEYLYDNRTYTETVLTNMTSGQTVEANLTVIDRLTNYGIYDKQVGK